MMRTGLDGYASCASAHGSTSAPHAAARPARARRRKVRLAHPRIFFAEVRLQVRDQRQQARVEVRGAARERRAHEFVEFGVDGVHRGVTQEDGGRGGWLQLVLHGMDSIPPPVVHCPNGWTIHEVLTMLSREDNELLVRVGPDTAMGKLMRLYWIPFLLARDVPADGQPYRVKLLGEELVAFRDSADRVGLVDQACPHRGAPLVFARNEEGGLRCVYHGWKFAVDGTCQEMPAEGASTPMLKKVKVKAYPVRERHGVLWAYMGPDQDPPALPSMEWNMVPEANVHVSMRIQECNWLQALEGEIDSAHAAILHGRVDAGGSIDQWKQAADLTPKFEVVQHEAGISIASRRKLGDEQNYIRVNQFLMPFWTLVPPFSDFPDLSGHAWVPIDDEHTLCIMFSYHPAQAFYENTRKLFKQDHKRRETGPSSDVNFETRPV